MIKNVFQITPKYFKFIKKYNWSAAISEIREQLPEDMKLLQLYGVCAPGVLDLRAEMSRQPADYPDVVDKPRYKDTLLYIYTSGTTGMPKAAVLPNSK